MQFHLNGFRTGDPGLFDAGTTEAPAVDRNLLKPPMCSSWAAGPLV